MTEITKEEAMAAIREAEIWTSDSGTIEMGSREDAATLLTLASAGAEVMFAGEETVERMARAICRARGLDPDLPTVAGVIRPAFNWAVFIPEARAALAALSMKE